MPSVADNPRPVRVTVVDLAGEIPPLAPDGEYASAWVVGCRGGVPQALVEVDLNTDLTRQQEQLQRLREVPPAPRVAGMAAVTDDELPFISVVIPSIVARIEELHRCLTSFDALDYPRLEVLLVDNRRDLPDPDPLPALLAGHAHTRSVRETRPGISAARNAGWAAARGDIVAFTDDDVHVDPGWLRAVGSRFVAEPTLDAVTGLILPAELDTPAQLWFERYYGGFSGERTFQPLTLTAGIGAVGRARVTARSVTGEPVRRFAIYGIGGYGAGANMAYRREALERNDEFNLTLGTGTPARGGEDLAALIDLLWAGGKLGYEPAAVVHHTHRREYAELRKQLRGNGIGFTAMLTSLIHRDSGHLVALAAQLPLAAQRLMVQNLARLRGRRPGTVSTAADGARLYPPILAIEEIRGMFGGPLAYRRSARADQAWVRAAGDRRSESVASS